MLNNKEKYIDFCKTREDMPIFFQPWWLDAVCVDGTWDACVYEEKGTILGVLPYYQTIFKGRSVIKMPMLTPFLGIHYFYPTQLKNSKFSFENKVAKALIEQLPNTTYFQQNQSPNFKNGLPFHWKNYTQTTRYTFQLNLSKPVYPNFHTKLKQDLRTAEASLACKESEDLKLFYEINQATFTNKNMTIPYSFDFLQKLDNTLKKEGKRKIFITYDSQQQSLAAGYFIWDKQTAYYLMAGHRGINPVAMRWTLWHAIQYFTGKVEVFDFEGSMVKNIALFFSRFGGEQIPYHLISKGKNKFIDVLKILKS